jgi:hypothetical protein
MNDFYFLSLCTVHISGINKAEVYLLLSITIDYYQLHFTIISYYRRQQW